MIDNLRNKSVNFVITSADLAKQIGKSSIEYGLTSIVTSFFGSILPTPVKTVLDFALGTTLISKWILPKKSNSTESDLSLQKNSQKYTLLITLSQATYEIGIACILMSSYWVSTWEEDSQKDYAQNFLSTTLLISASGKICQSSLKIFSCFNDKELNTKKVADEFVLVCQSLFNISIHNFNLKNINESKVFIEAHAFKPFTNQSISISNISEKMEHIYQEAFTKNLTLPLTVTDVKGNVIFKNTSEFFQFSCVQKLINTSSNGNEDQYLKNINNLISHVNKVSGCYTTELKSMMCYLSHVNHFDSSRCYSSFEIEFASKHGGIDYLAKGENNSVAILQGLDESLASQLYSPGFQSIYEKNKNVYASKVTNVFTMCKELDYAKKMFNSSLNVVVINFHGKPTEMLLGKEAWSSEGEKIWSPEILDSNLKLPKNCFDDVLDKKGTVVLMSCSTAGKFALKLSKLAPGRTFYAPKRDIAGFDFHYISQNNLTLTSWDRDTEQFITPINEVEASCPAFTPLKVDDFNLNEYIEKPLQFSSLLMNIQNIFTANSIDLFYTQTLLKIYNETKGFYILPLPDRLAQRR